MIIFETQNVITMADLTTTFAGLQLKNPIIVGSSGLTDSVDNIKSLENSGASAVVLKSLFEEEILREMEASMSKIQSESYLYPETLEFYEDQGPEEESTVQYTELIKSLKKEVHIPIIASINCITADQWTYFPELIESAGADALELNIFIFPSDLNRPSHENEKIYFDIIEEVTKQVNIPVIAKIGYYFTNVGTMIQRLSDTRLSGIVLFNRYYNPDFDIDTLEITSGGVLSHPSDIYQSLRWIGIMANRINTDMAATTGIHDGQGVIKQLLAGASAVQVASAIYNNGPGYITQMLEEVNQWMESKKFANISDFKGKLGQDNLKNPAAFERIQFMKYFRGHR